MKIALCLAGQARSFEKSYTYYKKNLFDRFDVDVFLHTWKFDNVEELINLYRPKKYIVNFPFDSEVFNCKYTRVTFPNRFPPFFTISSLFSIFQACLLKTHHEIETKQYDWVIKSRFDFALPDIIPFENLEKNKIYMPACRTKAFGDWIGNDQFAIGDSNIMNKYMSTYLGIENYYNNGYEMMGEEMLRATLLEHNITEKDVSYIDYGPTQWTNPIFPPCNLNPTSHYLIRDDYEKWTNLPGNNS
jgi:hypothetical protein